MKRCQEPFSSPRFGGRSGALTVEVNPNRATIVALVVEQLHAAIRLIQDMEDPVAEAGRTGRPMRHHDTALWKRFLTPFSFPFLRVNFPLVFPGGLRYA